MHIQRGISTQKKPKIRGREEVPSQGRGSLQARLLGCNKGFKPRLGFSVLDEKNLFFFRFLDKASCLLDLLINPLN